MTEIEILGERIFINNLTITGKNLQVVKLCKNLIVLLEQRMFYSSNEYTLAQMAIQNFDAKIIAGDALSILKPKQGTLY